MRKKLQSTVLTLLPALLITVFLSACGEHTTMVCDHCGKAFTANADYSYYLERQREIQKACGVDYYEFTCPECQREIAEKEAKEKGSDTLVLRQAIIPRALYPEEKARVEEYFNSNP